jgi:hypothetical protein
MGLQMPAASGLLLWIQMTSGCQQNLKNSFVRSGNSGIVERVAATHDTSTTHSVLQPRSSEPGDGTQVRKKGVVVEPTALLDGPPGIYMQTLLVHSGVMKKVGEFDAALRVMEDWDITVRISMETSLCYVNKPLVLIDRTPNRAEGLIELLVVRGTGISTRSTPGVLAPVRVIVSRTRRKAFIAMEYLNGATLKHLINGQAMELERLLDLATRGGQSWSPGRYDCT